MFILDSSLYPLTNIPNLLTCSKNNGKLTSSAIPRRIREYVGHSRRAKREEAARRAIPRDAISRAGVICSRRFYPAHLYAGTSKFHILVDVVVTLDHGCGGVD